MNRLEGEIMGLRAAGKRAFVPFLVGWYPDRATFRGLILRAQMEGADAVEIGVPCSDPWRDGPLIRRASRQAVAAGVTVDALLEDVAWARGEGLSVPVLFMSYARPLVGGGLDRFARAARAAGVDGALIVDLDAADEAACACSLWRQHLDAVVVVSPAATDDRLRRAAALCSGFVYCASVTGTTGGRPAAPAVVAQLARRVGDVTSLPALAGFGIRDPAVAGTVASVCDGVVVGTALLEAFDGLRGSAAVGAAGGLMSRMRHAVDGGGGAGRV